jgi:hypothetical protein
MAGCRARATGVGRHPVPPQVLEGIALSFLVSPFGAGADFRFWKGLGVLLPPDGYTLPRSVVKSRRPFIQDRGGDRARGARHRAAERWQFSLVGGKNRSDMVARARIDARAA